MAEPRVVIHGGTIVTSDGPVRADLILRGEQIAGIVADASDIEAAERIDATGLVVVPGGVDVHTHFRDPDPNMVEGFETGTRGALAGGITTAVEMPQAAPTSSSGEHIRIKRGLLEERSHIDIALWGGIVGQPVTQIEEMIDEGIVALKAFMPASSPGFPKADDQVLLDTFQFLAMSGSDMPFGIHCENDSLLSAGIARMQVAGRKDPLAHAESRPPLVEVEAIHRALFFAELTGARLYVCHVAAADGLALVKQARARGIWVEAETCPQYLSLDHTDLIRHGPFARCAPAFRDREEVERIWGYVTDGTVDVVSSDHCGYTIESKMAGIDDIWQAPLGCSGIQTMYPTLFDEIVNKRSLGLARFAELSATNPARIFSLYPKKGVIQVGSDADLAFYDPTGEWVVKGEELLHRNKWTPFEGKTIGASVVRTMLRGRTVFDRSQSETVVGAPGDGKFLSRGYGLGQV
ncbi:MAG TPA: allantoinase AllB [Thermomicrobiales bacterium]|nr:allantoinase AllB [Thermomicrobiales bacterium]